MATKQHIDNKVSKSINRCINNNNNNDNNNNDNNNNDNNNMSSKERATCTILVLSPCRL